MCVFVEWFIHCFDFQVLTIFKWSHSKCTVFYSEIVLKKSKPLVMQKLYIRSQSKDKFMAIPKSICIKNVEASHRVQCLAIPAMMTHQKQINNGLRFIVVLVVKIRSCCIFCALLSFAELY